MIFNLLVSQHMMQEERERIISIVGQDGLSVFVLVNVSLLAVDDVLLREFVELLPDVDVRAVAFSCQRLRRVIVSPPYARTLQPPSREHLTSSLALTKWALMSGWMWPKRVTINGHVRPGACEVAAGGGCQSVLELARPHVCPWDSQTCYQAA